MQALVGIDIGTQGVRAGLFAADGRKLASAFRPSRLSQSEPDVYEEDPELQFNSVCEVVRACVQAADCAAGEVAAIAVAGQMAGVIGVGADGRHVTPYDSWLDQRCRSMIGHMAERAGEEITRRTGGPPGPNHGPRMLWLKHHHPDVFDRVAAFVQPGGYAAMRLCGLAGDQAFIDTTYLHFTGFADNWRPRWDLDLCRMFEMDPAKLPRIVEPQHIAGRLTAAAAAACGLPAGTPVVAGCGDTTASFLAAGATRAGVGVDVAGTASVFATTSAHAVPDVQHRTLVCGRSVVPGLWHCYAYVAGGGMNLEWFRKNMAGSSKPLSLTELDALARQVSDEDDLPMFSPHLLGRACPSQPDQRGAWAGLLPHHTVAHLYHAVLEAVPLEYSMYLDLIRQMSGVAPLVELRVTGGGERSLVWNQIKADILGVPIVQVAENEGTARGAAMLAGFGVQLFDDLALVSRSWVHHGQVFQPEARRTQRATRRKRRYGQLINLLDQWSRECT